MNILFIGNYLSSSGWANASRSYLESLLLTKHNIAARPAYLCNSPTVQPTKAIQEAQDKHLDKIDVCIQSCLPDNYEKLDCYCIGILNSETRNCNPYWINKINILDELWVNSEAEKQSLIEDGAKCKISVVPIPIDGKKLNKYSMFAEDLNVPELNNKFVFYTIAENNERKNIMAFVRAFHTEFAAYEPVALVLKTNGKSIKDELNEWKSKSRTRAVYLPDILIDGAVEEKFLYSIHKGANCFVCSSYGESNCLSIGDALYFNNYVICTDNIFGADVYKTHIYPVKSNLVPVKSYQPPLPHIYSGKELWAEIDEIELRKTMRFIFEKRPEQDSKKFIEEFSPQNTAKRMEEILC